MNEFKYMGFLDTADGFVSVETFDCSRGNRLLMNRMLIRLRRIINVISGL
jgi:hypothetical protein